MLELKLLNDQPNQKIALYKEKPVLYLINALLEETMAMAYAEMLTNKPVRCCIDAVVDTELMVLRHPNFLSMYELNKDSEALGRKIAEQNFIEKEQREFEFLQLNAMQRYDAFLDRYGAIADIIPQYQIASYIGITSVAMSRLLKPRRG